MSNGFPCPNPVCTHVFAPEVVKGAIELKCPKCNHAFVFQKKAVTAPLAPKASTAHPKPPPIPPVPPVSPVKPAAPRVPMAAPLAAPVAAPVPPSAPTAPPSVPSSLQFQTDPDLLVRSPVSSGKGAKTKRTKQRGLIVRVMLFTLLAGFIGGMGYVMFWVLPQFATTDTDRRKVQLNFSFTNIWAYRDDIPLRKRMDVLVAQTRSDPRGHVALHAIDYKTRYPGDDELLEEALKRLKATFPRLQYQDPLGEGKTGELDGEPAYQFEFRGSAADEVPIIGECTFLTRRGIGYWLFAWGPAEDEDELPGRFARLRNGFRFANEREGWQPTPRETTVQQIGDMPIQLNYVHALWRVEPNPTDYDPRAALVLRGYEQTGERSIRNPVDTYAGKSAVVQILLLDRAEDLAAGVDLAKGHLTTQLAKIEPMVKLDTYTAEGGKAAVSPEVGAFKGELRQLEIKVSADTSRFGLLGVVNRPEVLLVVFGECPLEKRGYWLGEFKALVETIRPVR
jgi:hypothetical protein